MISDRELLKLIEPNAGFKNATAYIADRLAVVTKRPKTSERTTELRNALVRLVGEGYLTMNRKSAGSYGYVWKLTEKGLEERNRT